MKQLIFCLFALFLSAITGCVSISHKPDVSTPPFILKTPDSLPTPVSAYQEIEIQFNNKHTSFLAAVTVDDKQIIVAIMNSLGQRLFTLESHGSKTTSSGKLPNELKNHEKHIVRDIQWLFWPIDTLSHNQQPETWTFSETTNSRSIYYKDQLIAKITGPNQDKWNGQYSYDNYIYRYHISVKSTQLVDQN